VETRDNVEVSPYISQMTEKVTGACMMTITSVDLRKQFGRCRELALKQPVLVTHHGHETLVVLSAEEFKRLKALDTRQAFYSWELTEDLAQALNESEPPAFTSQFDQELET
jgi:PHD/YefM family antitoxin component YafN of YafNO toxin-antitoxin module